MTKKEEFDVESFLKKVAQDFSIVIQGKRARIGAVFRKTKQGTIEWADYYEEKKTETEGAKETKEGKLYVIGRLEEFLSERHAEEYSGRAREEVKNMIEEQVGIFLSELLLEIRAEVAAGKKSLAYQMGAEPALAMVGGYLFIEPEKGKLE